MKQNRRKFFKTAASAAFGFSILPNWVSGASKPPSSKLNVAFVGCGGRGGSACKDLCEYNRVNPVCFCDVDDARAAKTFGLFPNVPRLRDYRKMFDVFGKDIDAVVISTPDHTHYPIASWAMAAGKHVYLEKPMSRTIWESREIKRIAAKTGVVTQLGNQGHGMEHWRNVRDWYRKGIIGEVEAMYNWTDRPIWNQGPYPVPSAGEKIPETLDYDLWLNVAPKTPYSKEIVPFNWRGFRNYGTGAMGDHACHSFDWFYSALDLGMPTKVVSERSEISDFGWPKSTRTTFEFAPKDGRGAVKLHWCDASQKPAEVKRLPAEILAKTPNGGAIVGSRETAVCFDQYGTGTMISPRDRMVELIKSGVIEKKVAERPQTHWRNWADACLENKKAASDIVDYAASLNEFVLLGTISILFPERELLYDSQKGEFTNVKEANEFINSRYEYRKEFLVGKI